jgi:predicted transcriptional regulator
MPSDAGRKLIINANEASDEIERLSKGLASATRLEILRFLGSHTCSVKEIAEAFNMPASTAALHINQLEKSGLIRTELQPASRGLKKVCVRLYDQVVISLPSGKRITDNVIDIEMPIGAYVDCAVVPTCGLVSAVGIVGHLDDPETFYDPERLNAQLLWFKQGFVEYRFPNRSHASGTLENMQISFEACSEAPLHDPNWTSDITVWINDVEIGTWTSPGDFGGERGALTPDWWEEWNSQYGLLKIWKVTADGAYVDGTRVSNVTLEDLKLAHGQFISLRIGVKPDAENVGGLNLFGRSFGNYPQDIHMRMHFR